MLIDSMEKAIDELLVHLAPLTFGRPVAHIYNPLTYARHSHSRYLHRFGHGLKEVMVVGMNPGPWGMAQTGVPFGDVGFVSGWLGINVPVGTPDRMHPKRPIQGFGCARAEVSGRRLWGWARERFKTPEAFFKRFWVANYCPLVFMEESGRNRTPDKLPRIEKAPLFDACDKALRQSVQLLQPRCVIGVGNFATQRAQAALTGMNVTVGCVTHPSPANPKANQGWGKWMDQALAQLNVSVSQ
jgi:single-strand selective monofunctional uracil DNA glycosylase